MIPRYKLAVYGVAALAALAVGIVARNGLRKSSAAERTIARLEGDDVVLARVDSSAITQFDLEQTLVTTFGESGRNAKDDPKVRRTVLESLVQTRALARAADGELTPEERAVVDRQIAAHRDEVLAKRYLMRHAPPQPVTSKMVEDYYNAHPERFGAKTRRIYELIGSEGPVSGTQRDQLVAKLVDPGKQADWKAFAETLKRQGFPVGYRNGELADSETVLNPRLAELLSNLKAGQASQVAFVQGHAYVVRVTSEQRTPPRPLGEVRNEIQAALGPTQVSDAIKRASEELLKNAKVVYEEPKTSKP
jgi:hypothetical protein